MTKLEQAARQVLERWDNNTLGGSTITALRESLDHSGEANDMVFLTSEAAQQIEEALTYNVGQRMRDNALSILYAARAQEQAEHEPVAWMDLHKELGKLRWMGGDEGWDNAINAVRDRLIELATPHPVRTKDLTDDEIVHLVNSVWFLDELMVAKVNFARAVIAADREKNK